MAHAVFKGFDNDGSEKISMAELSGAVEKLGLNAKQSELESMIKDDDTNGDGELDLKEFMSIVERLQKDQSKVQGLAAIINRKAKTGPPMMWSECAGFKAFTKDELLRNDSSGHAVAVLDQWISTASEKYDKASVTLEIENVVNGDGTNDREDAFVGVVGCNFKTWDTALGRSPHAVAINARTGHSHFKGIDANIVRSLGPAVAKTKTRLHIELAMRDASMRIEHLSPAAEGGWDVECALTLEQLPPEVAVAVSLPAGAGQRVRLIGSSTERTPKRERRNSKDLWDEDNKIVGLGAPLS